MTEIIEIIVQYVSIWAPSLVAMLGVVTAVLVALGKTKAAINEFKSDKCLKELTTKVEELATENAELVNCNKLLLDEITRIKDYAKKKERP